MLRLAHQSCHWQARPLSEVEFAGTLEASLTAGPEAALRIAGWALARRAKLRAIEARSPGRVIEAAIEDPSEDVAAIDPDAPGVANCRFAVDLPADSLGAEELEWTLWAIGEDGSARHFGTLVLEAAGAAGEPVFVLGAARSGTTAVGTGVREALGRAGYGECHVMPLLVDLVESVHGYYDSPNPAAAAADEDVLLGHVSAEEWLARLASTIRTVYANLHRGSAFVDKTPGTAMIGALHVIMEAWPNARVVFSRRRGLENIESRRRKFPEQDFAGHCNDWSAAMLTWNELKVLVPESQRMEIDQIELATDPVGASARLGALVDLDEDGRATLARYFEDNSPERTASDWSPVALDDLDWSEQMRDRFAELCGEAMDAFGYSLDRGYWKDSPIGAPARSGGEA